LTSSPLGLSALRTSFHSVSQSGALNSNSAVKGIISSPVSSGFPQTVTSHGPVAHTVMILSPFGASRETGKIPSKNHFLGAFPERVNGDESAIFSPKSLRIIVFPF